MPRRKKLINIQLSLLDFAPRLQSAFAGKEYLLGISSS